MLFRSKLHPDLNPGDKAAEDKFKEVAAANDLLGDADKRRRFDAGEMDMKEFYGTFLSLGQFAEVGQGNMNWPALLPAAEKAGAEYFLIEQDDTYGRDPIDCIRESREYLRSIGY